MKDEKETRRKLLESAKAEFLEKGYLQASLRNICKKAGVTTGALYFFFQGKEDLFAALVEKPLQMVRQMMHKHYESEIAQVTEEKDFKIEFSDDEMMSARVLHYMYQYYDEFQLILTKSQGSRFESAIDEFVAYTEKHYRIYIDYIVKYKGYETIADYLVHWIAHMHIDAFIHLLTHVPSEEEAQQYMQTMVKYMISGWYDIFPRLK